jgi:succinate dehydrogenase hydrophobic anchor subunit
MKNYSIPQIIVQLLVIGLIIISFTNGIRAILFDYEPNSFFSIITTLLGVFGVIICGVIGLLSVIAVIQASIFSLFEWAFTKKEKK